MDQKVDLIEYTFIKNENATRLPPKKRFSLGMLLTIFQVGFIAAFWYYAKNMDFATYKAGSSNDVGRLYSSNSIKLYYILLINVIIYNPDFKCSWMFIQ